MSHYFSIEMSRFLKSILFDFGFLLWPLAWIFIISKSFWVKRITLFIVALILLFGTNLFSKVGNQLLSTLSKDDHLPSCPAAAIVVLGGGVISEEIPNLTTQLRLQQAGKVLQNMTLPVIYTGGSTELAIPESEIMARYGQLVLPRQPTELYLERESRSTHENAIYTAELVNKLALQKHVILVTSSWHMLRARLSFKKAGFSVCSASVSQSEFNKFWEISFQNGRDSKIILNELFGLFGYFFQDWI